MKPGKRTAVLMSAHSRLSVVALTGIAALVAVACSNSGLTGGGGVEAGVIDGACGPLPESLSVAALNDCVATTPNPCCTGFYAFSCAPTAGAAGGLAGAQCSETTTCVRAARYDQTLCLGAEAYSCPDLSGANYATMTKPSCEQMEVVGPAGEGVRWCCGPNLPPAPALDAATPPAQDDAGEPVDAPTSSPDSSVDSSLPPLQDSSVPPTDSFVPPPPDSSVPPKDASSPPDATPIDAAPTD